MANTHVMWSSPTVAAILVLTGWYLAILLALLALRAALTMFTGRSAGAFDPTGTDLPGLGQRLTRAHANLCETLPFVMILLLLAVATGREMGTDPLALPFVVLRVAQTAVHLASVAHATVILRFGLFLPQIAIMGWWCTALANA